MRKSGILAPVFSLPSRYGIGSFSKEAYEFVDFLADAGQKLWQVLPLGPTGYGDSPYQSFSTFAGNPYFIDLDALVEKGWLAASECEEADFGSDEERVDYEKLYHVRFPLLKKAYLRSGIEEDPAFQDYIGKNAYWLEDYSLYMAIKDARGGASYLNWEEPLRRRETGALQEAAEKLAGEVGFYRFLQYEFSVQWQALKAYANGRGIQIIGDIPIYVSPDGADVWAHPELFALDEEGLPSAVAGCPPDAFSATGQLWGNPLYDWEYHRQTGYAWWMRRIEHCFELVDVLRIDHFRGFESYYSIPYGDPTAEFGHWEKGPDYDFFRVMKQQLGRRQVIAEDLGYLTPAVYRLCKKTGYPGMKVLQFAFDAEDSAYLPHRHTQNSVVYTGTHDNQTTVAWVEELGRANRTFARKYLHVRRNRDIPEAMIRAALSSVADTAVIPLQDWLGLGADARINHPSTLGGNWEWRMRRGVCDERLSHRIREMTRLYGR